MAIHNIPSDADERDEAPILFAFPDQVHAWRLVRLGLRMSYFGAFSAAAVVLPGMCLWIGILIFHGGRGTGLTIATYATLGLILSALFVTWIGRWLCCAVPVESGARNQAIASAVCVTLLAMIGGAWLLLQWTGHSEVLRLDGLDRHGRDVLFFMAGLLMFALHAIGHVLFVLTLRKIGLVFRGVEQTQNARVYLSMYRVLMCVYFALTTLAMFVQDFTGAACVLSLCLLASSLLLFFLFLMLIGGTFDLIDDALKRSAN